MKTNSRIDYFAPEAGVFFFNLSETLMATSTLGDASSESFQSESDYESIW
jgi:hypothetical protein